MNTFRTVDGLNLDCIGIAKMARIDTKYIEVTTISGKTALRTIYNLGAGKAEVYHNNNRIVVESLADLPMAVRAEAYPQTPVQQPVAKAEPTGAAKHARHEMIKTCVNNDLPVYLVGEAGTGKNYTLQVIAEELGLTFYFTNSVQQEYKITGFVDAGGKFHETEFYKAFTTGGLFFLDEIDASIPEVLVLLNAAIANRYFEFPTGRVDAHPDFRVVAAGNTLGNGANEQYTGRLTLDAATLDRFVVIEFDYDRGIELSLAKGNVHLVEFVRDLRAFCKQNGIRSTFSYRMIISVQKLETAGMPLKDILTIAVLKGLDKDTVATLKVDSSRGHYYQALKEIQTGITGRKITLPEERPASRW